MQEILDDIGHPTWLPFTVIAARLALATLFGAVIGFEREWRNHPAGLRTHILVSLAAASFTIIGIEIVHSSQFANDAARQDPLRLIEAVTAGVAFLAAGGFCGSRCWARLLAGRSLRHGACRHRPWADASGRTRARSSRLQGRWAQRSGHSSRLTSLSGLPNAGNRQAMEELFGHPGYKHFVLQDVKRLPARFYARISAALLGATA
jgi:hypothetical protein